MLDDMRETMYADSGIGLAAIQVDIPWRLVVIDVSETRDQPIYLVNPEIIAASGTTEYEEGCLSVPNFTDWVSRAAEITLRALDYNGLAFELHADGLLAICIQHELDHLDGKLFVDYLSALKRERIRQKLLKADRVRDKPKKAAHAASPL
jgi:peptide deformylase